MGNFEGLEVLCLIIMMLIQYTIGPTNMAPYQSTTLHSSLIAGSPRLVVEERLNIAPVNKF